MSAQGVIFDLDGTLLNTLSDLGGAVNRSLDRRGFPSHGVEAYRWMVGNGLRRLVELALPESSRSDTEVESMRAEVDAWLMDHPVVDTKPYAGVPELLRELEQRSLPMAILTNKPDALTRHVVARLLSDVAFVVVQGQRPDVPRKPDPRAALGIAEKMGLEARDVIFLGDSDVDMQTAAAAGMYAVGAAWGFRGADELRGAGARRIIEAPGELLALFPRYG